MSDVPEGWVEIRTLARLWESVPEHERVTEAHVRAVWQGKAPSNGGPHWAANAEQSLERDLRRLKAEGCEIAVHVQGTGQYAGLWWPCAQDVHQGARRCVRHGGPPKSSHRGAALRDLRAENARLREQLRAAGVDA